MQMKSTKKALVLSLLSLVVCVSLLIGTTFAWFTDSVTSANNKIIAGNLKVDLEVYTEQNDGSYKFVSVKNYKTAIFNYSLWEPGYVEAELLKVENEGSLALKWKAMFVSAGELGILADVIDVYVMPGLTEEAFLALQRDDLANWTKAGTVREFVDTIETSTYGTLLANQDANLGLALKMQETAGNEYQNEALGAFDIKIVATQLASEEDSFDENYDIFADYDGEISNAATFEAALEEGGTFKVTDSFTVPEAIEAGDEDVFLDLNGNNITTTSDDGYVINNTKGGTLIIGDSSASTTYALRRTAGSTINGVVYTGKDSTTIVNGGTFNTTDRSNYVFLNSQGTLIINNATINGKGTYPVYSYNEGNKLEINNVTINADFGCVNAYGKNSEIVINGGTFNMSGTKGQTSHIAYFSASANVTINGGNFNKIGDISMSATGGGGVCVNGGAKVTIYGGSFAGDYADIYNYGGTLVVKNGTFKFDPKNFLADGYKTVKNGDVWTIEVDVPAGFENLGYFKEGNVYYVYNADGLKAVNDKMVDKTAGRDTHVVLLADIDMTGKTWTPVDSHADSAFEIEVFDGNGFTISNLTINGQAMFKRFAGLGDVTFKNVTFDNATVNSKGSINTAIICGHTYQNVLLDNVDVKNSSITGGYKVAPLIGTVYNEGSSTITATLKNCDVANTVVKATSYDFCTTGMVAFVYADDNDKVEFANCTVSDVELYAPNVYTAHAWVYTTGSETLFNEVAGVTVTNVTFENI